MDKRFCLGDERNCPYYRPRSNSCLWSLCPLSKESAVDEFHYIAAAGAYKHKTEAEAIKWATEQLSDKLSLDRIYIYRVIDVIERESPPIKVREIHNPSLG